MSWMKDRDGAFKLNVDPDSTITNAFRFLLGTDVNCNDITISSFTTTTRNKVSVLNSSFTPDTVTLQTTGCGEVLIILTLSNGDIRRPIRRYAESTKSTIF